ncbi:MAG: nuclear transport factor 2 family protein, partial [Alphaproteobacteria bacterium]|nr:nuclear transport factor 2 family protein [Alphaproteobacteria bacterium]
MHPIDRFTSTFVRISADTPVDVPTLYAPSIVFADPAHRVEGVEALAAYFARLDANLVEARFEFHEEVRGERSAALRWRMHARLRFPPGRTVDVEGTSWLQHDGTHITAQTDHFDLGALVYEQVP